MTHIIIPKLSSTTPIKIDSQTLNGLPASYYLDCNNFINCPVIPTSLADFGITDGTDGQFLSTDGQGSYVFRTIEIPDINIDGGAASTVFSPSNSSFNGSTA